MAKSEPRKRSSLLDWLVYVFSVLVLIFLLVSAGKENLRELVKPKWTFLAAAFVVTVIFVLALALRYRNALLLVGQTQNISIWSAFYATAFAMTIGIFASKGIGQVIGKPVIMKNKEGTSLGSGIHASLLEKIADLVQSIILSAPLIGISLFGTQSSYNQYALAVIVLSVLLSALKCRYISDLSNLIRLLIMLLLRCIKRLSSLSMKPKIAEWQLLFEQHHVSDRILSHTASFSFFTTAKLYLMAMRMACLSMAFDLNIPWQVIILGIPMVQLGISTSFTPGSLGFLEASWFGVFYLIDFDTSSLPMLLIAIRFTNFLFFPLISIGAAFLYRLFFSIGLRR